MRKYIGIDIGKRGAIYILNEDGTEHFRSLIPLIKMEVDYHRINEILEGYEMFNGMVVFEI